MVGMVRGVVACQPTLCRFRVGSSQWVDLEFIYVIES